MLPAREEGAELALGAPPGIMYRLRAVEASARLVTCRGGWGWGEREKERREGVVGRGRVRGGKGGYGLVACVCVCVWEAVWGRRVDASVRLVVCRGGWGGGAG